MDVEQKTGILIKRKKTYNEWGKRHTLWSPLKSNDGVDDGQPVASSGTADAPDTPMEA